MNKTIAAAVITVGTLGLSTASMASDTTWGLGYFAGHDYSCHQSSTTNPQATTTGLNGLLGALENEGMVTNGRATPDADFLNGFGKGSSDSCSAGQDVMDDAHELMYGYK